MTDKKTWDTSSFEKPIREFNEEYPVRYIANESGIVAFGPKPFLRAIWDEEAGCYISESNITGLHIEAVTLEAFEEVAKEAVPHVLVECATMRS